MNYKVSRNAKKLLLFIPLLGSLLLSTGCEKGLITNPTGSMTDGRDGESYATVTIGGQKWMAENLRHNVTGSWENPAFPSAAYGRLYDWNTAENICPAGWHLPTDEEWKTMEIRMGLSEEEANESAEFRGSIGIGMKSTTGWSASGNGTNTSGFNAYPAGYYRVDSLSHHNLEIYANFWTATESSGAYAWLRTLAHNRTGVNRSKTQKENGYSCRCVED